MLRARRTWRRFSNTPMARAKLATLLQLTWGVQQHILIPGQGRFVLKTSPSGGARHPLEAYVIALNVAGLRRGVYHYAAGDHHLVDMQRHVSKRLVTHLLANQGYFAGAGAIVVMSAVFARTMWKYQHSRAYRAILTEAGHFAQTFCLVATALGLAPFCTMAFRDSDVDALLGLDGLDEAAIYVVGAGTRPSGTMQPGRVGRRGEFFVV
jgi:SagB-type dehydrogenase family enzyme